MIAEKEQPIAKKRVLRNIRAHLLHKKPENEQEEELLDVPKPINPYNIRLMDPSAGIIEKNRKIYIGMHHLNSFVKIDDITISDQFNSKAITLTVSGPDKTMAMMREYNIQRLESYGDLELATWAHRIRTMYMTFPVEIRKYLKVLETGEKDVIEHLEDMKQKVKQAQKDIESKYPYKKMAYKCDDEKRVMVSLTVNEELLKETGQSTEDFISWAKNNGLPELFETNSKAYAHIGKTYLSLSFVNIEPVKESPEMTNYIYDVNGCKKEIVTQYIRTTEPTSYGFINTLYVIIKSNKMCEENDKTDELIAGMKTMMNSPGKKMKALKEKDNLNI